jgi:hypothetical protein
MQRQGRRFEPGIDLSLFALLLVWMELGGLDMVGFLLFFDHVCGGHGDRLLFAGGPMSNGLAMLQTWFLLVGDGRAGRPVRGGGDAGDVGFEVK